MSDEAWAVTYTLAAQATSNGTPSGATLAGGANSHTSVSGAQSLPSLAIEMQLADKAEALLFIGGHNAWIKRGFDDGVFLLTGSLQPNAGGAIFAHDASPEEIEARVQDDPFVAEAIVSAEILTITPGRTDERLAFLKA